MPSTSHTIEPTPEPVQGGWYGSEMAEDPASWRVPLPADVRDDLLRAAADMGPGDVGVAPFQPRPSVSERTLSLVADLSRRLAGEPGVVVLTGFPVQDAPELTERAYLLLGILLGRPLPQELNGRLLTRVEFIPPDADAHTRIGIPSALPYHVDTCSDVIGLLCIRSAQIGGRSRLVSSKKMHNILLERHPELLSVLYQPVPVPVPPLRGPDGDSKLEWHGVPTFSRVGGDFACYCWTTLAEEMEKIPDAPGYTPEQVAAINAADEVTKMPEMPLEMELLPGDLQLINNLSVLHSRTAYTSDRPEQGRLLLRMHLAFAGSPSLSSEFAALYGATAAGTFRGGSWRTTEFQDRFGTPMR